MRTFARAGICLLAAVTAFFIVFSGSAASEDRQVPTGVVVRNGGPGNVSSPPPQTGDDVVVRLPGAESRPVKPFSPPAARPARPGFVLPAPGQLATSDWRRIMPPVAAPRPEPPARLVPPDMLADSAVYLRDVLGSWREADARDVLGSPKRHRLAVGEDGKPDGDIYAFEDPTSRYREFELDFDRETGVLRTLFVYPWRMTWSDCQQLWDGDVSSSPAPNGRTFHSYVNRRLDVLVDASGQVVSLGLY